MILEPWARVWPRYRPFPAVTRLVTPVTAKKPAYLLTYLLYFQYVKEEEEEERTERVTNVTNVTVETCLTGS